MLGAAKAIRAATQRLQQLMARPRGSGRSTESAVDLQVHDSILRFLSAALKVANPIAHLIKEGRHRAGQGRKLDTAILQT
jgi:hypothetical protein